MNASILQFWASITQKFEALNQRERWLVFGAALILVYSIINTLMLEPVLLQKESLTNIIKDNQSQLITVQQQLSQFSQQSIIDPDAPNKQRIAALESNLQSLENQLKDLQTTLIDPNEVPELLRSLLKKNGKLKLVELKTLPTTGLLDGTSANAATPNATDANLEQTNTRIQSEVSKEYATPVFKHGVEITIEGRYLDLLAYVSELEKMPWHILWSKAGLNTEQPTPNQWPINRLKLTVYTLSLDQAWLSI